jgi:hypothetical protein
MSYYKEDDNVRKIVQNGRGSYYVNIPIELFRALGWRERRRVTVEKRGVGLFITDYDPKKKR